jgi:hypothetical protein
MVSLILEPGAVAALFISTGVLSIKVMIIIAMALFPSKFIGYTNKSWLTLTK